MANKSPNIDTSVPCYGCEDRHVGCHDACAAYQEYKNRRYEEKQNMLRANAFNSYFRKAMMRSKFEASRLKGTAKGSVYKYR